MRIVPVCEPPRELIAAMVDAGAQKEEVEGEDLHVVRIDGVVSKAWEVYKEWACSPGEVDPLVQAFFAPTSTIGASFRFQKREKNTHIQNMSFHRKETNKNQVIVWSFLMILYESMCCVAFSAVVDLVAMKSLCFVCVFLSLLK